MKLTKAGIVTALVALALAAAQLAAHAATMAPRFYYRG
jgi:hypothetical protein